MTRHTSLLLALSLACTIGCGDDEPEDANNTATNVSTNVSTGNASTNNATDTNPCFTEEVVTMTETAEDGLAVYYCPGEDPRGCGSFVASCDSQERLTFLQEGEGLYGVRGRLLILSDPDVGTPSGQTFPGVSDVPEDTRLTATVLEDTPGPFGSYEGTLEVTFSGDTVTIHTLVDPKLPEE